MGLPEMVYTASLFHGDKVAVEAAIAAGQVERFSVNGVPWLRNATKECVKESGNGWNETISQFGHVDDKKAAELVAAMEAMNWELPELTSCNAQRCLTAGKCPESAHEPLEEVIEATFDFHFSTVLKFAKKHMYRYMNLFFGIAQTAIYIYMLTFESNL